MPTGTHRFFEQVALLRIAARFRFLWDDCDANRALLPLLWAAKKDSCNGVKGFSLSVITFLQTFHLSSHLPFSQFFLSLIASPCFFFLQIPILKAIFHVVSHHIAMQYCTWIIMLKIAKNWVQIKVDAVMKFILVTQNELALSVASRSSRRNWFNLDSKSCTVWVNKSACLAFSRYAFCKRSR